ncbi:UDP-glucose dehydrogenase family protein [Paenibacillus mucilaginosus]|uniref:UDP-glucose 6-dehydrogenase n=1 Tax=Paenibacillus mucilaginosus 3016 TaxID=1116391 RepID=H6NE26_9BACL|nr:UDP-glucose/GDP-mannose dehydrogenase family protein [Paenibacillus mucilaginosus]AFC32979.1 TuaD [Paenibacillus mucilaginosus 3016]MCG7212869.1 UDP-glucose/GDP-mannose dehydrogenase family protein [Paenibacillus mucilaginosus]WDM26710.1 UDP-glucose/GDP-mannose dehydrogenase family protein [Paenibacillus mucilaginosus]WFA21422.1 UDP-glucose/GDP-mannose dehydrogenase family protein [Paenibacillus mucilaginosus]
MKITVIGTGYVGLVSGVCFAELGNEVVCVDKIKAKIDSLNRGEVPIYEPGIEELIEKNTKEGRLSFSDNLTEPVENSEIIIIAVGTPPLPNGEADLQYVDQVARDIALAMNGYKIVMTKSTVPVGTNERIKGIISELTAHPFDVVSVPEFLREGSAIKDTLNPDRIIIGSDSPKAQEQITRLHQPLTDNIIITDIRSAEMIKYASNAFLATKISFINEIANICEKVGADVTKVAVGMGYDKRIGSSFLQAGIGYGGSCFPKDTGALIQIAGNVNYEFKLLKAVVDVNTDQRFNVIAKLKESLGDLKDRTIGIWGLAFKPNTDDIRDAPAIDIVEALVAAGARIRVYDPIAMPNFKRVVQHASIEWCDEPYEVATGCDAVCLLTEWDEFKNVDLIQAEALMKQPILIDGRNVFSKEQIEKTNFSYYSVGRPSMTRHYREPVNN